MPKSVLLFVRDKGHYFDPKTFFTQSVSQIKRLMVDEDEIRNILYSLQYGDKGRELLQIFIRFKTLILILQCKTFYTHKIKIKIKTLTRQGGTH